MDFMKNYVKWFTQAQLEFLLNMAGCHFSAIAIALFNEQLKLVSFIDGCSYDLNCVWAVVGGERHSFFGLDKKS